MSLCKSGQILNCCHPNALMTLSEYLEDKELEKIPNQKVRAIAEQNIADIQNSNHRDFRF